MESTKICSKCGTQAEADKKFCMNCGSRLEADIIEATAVVTETKASEQIKTAEAKETPIRCGSCGEKVFASQKVCPFCGKSLDAPEVLSISEPTNKCTVCGFEVPRINKFCNRCGADMNMPTERELYSGTNPFMQPGGTPVSESTSICRFCGSEVKSNAAFCPKCGNANQSAVNYNYNANVPKNAYTGGSGLAYGILAVIFGIFGGWLAIAFGICGIVTAKKSGCTPALVLSIIGLCLVPVSVIYWSLMIL